jgi:acyl carrier protein
MDPPKTCNPKFKHVLDTVRRQVALLSVDAGVDYDRIGPETSLVEDLCFDSLRFVDLTLALEQELGLKEFPMQTWVDEQTEKETRAFTVQALVDACINQLSKDNSF